MNATATRCLGTEEQTRPGDKSKIYRRLKGALEKIGPQIWSRALGQQWAAADDAMASQQVVARLQAAVSAAARLSPCCCKATELNAMRPQRRSCDGGRGRGWRKETGRSGRRRLIGHRPSHSSFVRLGPSSSTPSSHFRPAADTLVQRPVVILLAMPLPLGAAPRLQGCPGIAALMDSRRLQRPLLMPSHKHPTRLSSSDW